MIEINLIPEAYRKKEAIRLSLPLPDRRLIVKVVGVVVSVQLLLAAFAVYQRFELGLLKRELVSLGEKTKEITQKKKDITVMKQQIKDMRSLTQRKFNWSSFLNALTRSMTKGVWLRGIEVTETMLSKGAKDAKASPADKSGSGQKVKAMRFDGSVIAKGQETAAIGKYIKSLKDDPFMSSLFFDVELSGMNLRKVKEYDVYDFILYVVFRKEKL